MVFPSHGYSNHAGGSLGLWRSRPPPQSFLPVGIGEATPLVTSFDFFDFVSLRNLSYLWAFVRAFQILCSYLGVLPFVDIFLHFFEVKKQGKSLWVSFSGIAGRILFSLFQNSYKGWKGKFFRVCCTKQDPTALDGFPLILDGASQAAQA